ncbi:MAG: DUF262 domain-containing protein [Candidatus Nanoarchaeia archaeon]|nr:DUF262 domain-containing protein [Candidatus Nanoarchaeia archaeon]
MAFKTENRKIADIFQRAAKYNIPRYQREYVWIKTNWEELINDIEFSQKVSNPTPWSHFLGTIVLSDALSPNKSIVPIGGIKDYEVIDGQQRITTLYVLLIVIYHRYLKEKNENTAKWIYETYLTSQASDYKRHMMVNNPDYDKALKELIDKNPEDTLSKNNKFSSLYLFLAEEIMKYDDKMFESFLNSMLNINIVEIVSDQEEEIYNIFEVLNARGQKLRQIELLKNHIMKYIQPREKDFIDKTREKWNMIMENISFLNDSDDFIRHFAKSYIEKQAKNNESVYRLMKDEIHISDLSQLLNELCEYSIVYKQISLNEIQNVDIDYFNIKNNKQIRPLICSLYILLKNKIISELHFIKSLKNLRNFFFLFNVYGETSNRTDSIISNSSFKLYKVKSLNHFKMLINNLFVGLSSYLPSSDIVAQFNNNLSFKYSNKDKRLKRNNRLVKYILVEMAAQLQTDSSLLESDLTIEHLICDDGYTINANIENLTITSEVINSNVLSNKNIEDKIKILKERSSIILNHNLENYFSFESSKFDFTRRKDDINNLLFGTVFKFDKYIFNISQTQLCEFNDRTEMLKDEKDLLNILLEYGTEFEKQITNDPKLSNSLNRYQKIVSSIDESS